jgi:Family of unknown function (DUF6152)
MNMKRRDFVLASPALASLAAFATLATSSTSALAHHGWSSFDEAKPLYFIGKVKSMKWQNPHAEVIITMASEAALPMNLAKRVAPKQSNTSVDGAKVFAAAALPKRRGDWNLELSPMTRIEAWKIAQPKVGDTVEAIAYTYKDEKGDAVARVEYWIIGEMVYGIRSMPV